MTDAVQMVWIDSPEYLLQWNLNYEAYEERFPSLVSALARIDEALKQNEELLKEFPAGPYDELTLEHFSLWEGRELELYAVEKVTVSAARVKGNTADG
jgi:hypothetical protein